MEIVYLVMEADIETSRVINVYASLDEAISKASLRQAQVIDWGETVSIDVWVVGGGKITSYDYTGRVKRM